MVLSPHFTLTELTATHTGLPNVPSRSEIENLRTLCRVLLEPLRERFGPLRVTSGYRSPRVNEKVGGAKQSAHRYGCAADLVPVDPAVSVGDLWRWLAQAKGLPLDQAIWEKRRGSEWLHAGICPPHRAAPQGAAWKDWR